MFDWFDGWLSSFNFNQSSLIDSASALEQPKNFRRHFDGKVNDLWFFDFVRLMFITCPKKRTSTVYLYNARTFPVQWEVLNIQILKWYNIRQCLWSCIKSLWRNRLARSAVNRKVGGSSPPRDGSFLSTTILGGDGHFLTTTTPNLVNRTFSSRVRFLLSLLKESI